MEEASSIKSCDLCATKDVKILVFLQNTIMLQKTIVEIEEKARRTVKSKDIFIEGMSKEVDRIIHNNKKEYDNAIKIIEALTKEYEEII